MTLKDARAVRDLVRRYGVACTVPLAHASGRYVARIWCVGSARDFISMQEARDYIAGMLRRRRRVRDEMARAVRRDTRSPLERMIDRACGREVETHGVA